MEFRSGGDNTNKIKLNSELLLIYINIHSVKKKRNSKMSNAFFLSNAFLVFTYIQNTKEKETFMFNRAAF